MKFYYALILICSTTFAFAQERGKITVHSDIRLEEVVEQHIRYNENHPYIKGYRLQIAAHSTRDIVLKEKSKFINLFPDIPLYVSYQQPYFKLRAGDFRNRLMAEKYLQEITLHFPGAFVVPEKVKIPDL